MARIPLYPIQRPNIPLPSVSPQSNISAGAIDVAPSIPVRPVGIPTSIDAPASTLSTALNNVSDTLYRLAERSTDQSAQRQGIQDQMASPSAIPPDQGIFGLQTTSSEGYNRGRLMARGVQLEQNFQDRIVELTNNPQYRNDPIGLRTQIDQWRPQFLQDVPPELLPQMTSLFNRGSLTAIQQTQNRAYDAQHQSNVNTILTGLTNDANRIASLAQNYDQDPHSVENGISLIIGRIHAGIAPTNDGSQPPFSGADAARLQNNLITSVQESIIRGRWQRSNDTQRRQIEQDLINGNYVSPDLGLPNIDTVHIAPDNQRQIGNSLQSQREHGDAALRSQISQYREQLTRYLPFVQQGIASAEYYTLRNEIMAADPRISSVLAPIIQEAEARQPDIETFLRRPFQEQQNYFNDFDRRSRAGETISQEEAQVYASRREAFNTAANARRQDELGYLSSLYRVQLQPFNPTDENAINQRRLQVRQLENLDNSGHHLMPFTASEIDTLQNQYNQAPPDQRLLLANSFYRASPDAHTYEQLMHRIDEHHPEMAEAAILYGMTDFQGNQATPRRLATEIARGVNMQAEQGWIPLQSQLTTFARQAVNDLIPTSGDVSVDADYSMSHALVRATTAVYAARHAPGDAPNIEEFSSIARELLGIPADTNPASINGGIVPPVFGMPSNTVSRIFTGLTPQELTAGASGHMPVMGVPGSQREVTMDTIRRTGQYLPAGTAGRYYISVEDGAGHRSLLHSGDSPTEPFIFDYHAAQDQISARLNGVPYSLGEQVYNNTPPVGNVPNQVVGAIIEASQIAGVQPEVLMAIAQIESNFNPSAHNDSGASGLFQFMEGTWNDMVAQHGAEAHVSANQINDPRANAVMAGYLIRDSVAALNQNGFPVNARNIYMLHLMGTGGGINFLRQAQSNPTDIPAESMPEAAQANPLIFYRDGNRRQPLTISGVLDQVGTRLDTNAAAFRQEMNRGTPARTVSLGDSLAAGIGISNSGVVNLGHIGDNISQVETRVSQIRSGDRVILNVGSNDVELNQPDRFRERFTALINNIQNRNARVVVYGLNRNYSEAFANYDDIIHQVADRLNVPYIPQSEPDQGDRLHYSPSGYRRNYQSAVQAFGNDNVIPTTRRQYQLPTGGRVRTRQ